MMKYEYDTNKRRIIKLVMKRACSFDEIKLIEHVSSSQLSEILLDLEKKGLLYSIWKHEKFLKKNKPYTKIRRIYLSSDLLQLFHKWDNIVHAMKSCRTTNSRMCNNAKRK